MKTYFALRQNIDKVISISGAIPLGYAYICYLDILKDQYDNRNISFTLNHKNKYQKKFKQINLLRNKVELYVEGKIFDEISKEPIADATLIYSHHLNGKHSLLNLTDNKGEFYQTLFSKIWNISTISFRAQKKRYITLTRLLKINQTHLISMARKIKIFLLNGSIFEDSYGKNIPLKGCKILFTQSIYNITEIPLESNNNGIFYKKISVYDLEKFNISISVKSCDQDLNIYQIVYFVESLKFLENLRIDLHRKLIIGIIKGKCINSKKQELKDVQLFFIIQEKNEEIIKTLSDGQGNFKKEIEFLQGLNYSIQIMAFQTGYELKIIDSILSKENNYMVQHLIEIEKVIDSFLIEKIGSIYGFVFDQSTNLPIELSSITVIFNKTTNYSSESQNEGSFNLSFQYTSQQNPVIIKIKSEKYYKYKTMIIFPQNNSSQLNLQKIYLKRKEFSLKISGSIKNVENSLNLKEVEIKLKLCFLQCSENVFFSGKNGSFSFEKKLEIERNYNFSLKMKKKGFQIFRHQSHFFTEINKTLLDLGDFFLSREQINFKLEVELIDEMGHPINNASLTVFNDEKNINMISDNNGQCIVTFKIFARKKYHFEFVIKHEYYELKKKIISLSLKTDYIGKVDFTLQNRRKRFIFFGSLLDDSNKTKISNAFVVFELCDLECFNLTKNSDFVGSFSFPVILKLGMPFQINIFLTAEHFLSKQLNYQFFSKLDNTITVFPDILLIRTKLTILFNGEVKNTTLFPQENVKISVFSLNVSSSSNDKGRFSLPIDCLEGKNYNYRINFKKIGYKEKNLNQAFKCNIYRKEEITVILEKAMAFAEIEGFLIDNYTKESIPNMNIYLKICESIHLFNFSEYNISSDEFGHFKFTIKNLNFIGGEYKAIASVFSEFFHTTSKEAILNNSHDYYINFDNIALDRVLKKISYILWIKDQISNENLTNVMIDFQQSLLNKTQLNATLYSKGVSNEIGNYFVDVDLAKGMSYNFSSKLEKNFYEPFFFTYLIYIDTKIEKERLIIF